MQLYYATASPFARKCRVVAAEAGLRERVELVPAAAHPVNRDRTLVARNPLGKVPTLVTDDGDVLYDSRVICEYLDAQGGGTLLPKAGAARWRVLVEQSLADGILDAALLARYENAVRPEALRWSDWTAGQLDKVGCGLADLDARAAAFGDRVDVGTIAFGCALGYLDFRYANEPWRPGHPKLEAWYAKVAKLPPLADTVPVG